MRPGDVKKYLQEMSTVFSGLTHLHTADGDDWSEVMTFSPGEVVFHQGDAGDFCYFIRNGTVSVIRTDDDGTETLLAKLGAGQCFGELALIHDAPRAATIVADEAVESIAIRGSKFLELYDALPDLKGFVGALQKIYPLAGKGFRTQGAGRFLDHDCVTTTHHGEAGITVVSQRVIGVDLFHLQVLGVDAVGAETVRFIDGDNSREVVIVDGKIAEITVHGEWSELGEAYRIAVNGQPFPQTTATIFRLKGTLSLESRGTLDDDAEVVCGCTQVTQGQLRKALLEGHDTEDKLAEFTGASGVCGACRPRISELIGRVDWTSVIVAEEIRHNNSVRSFRLQPCGKPVATAKPGQHIVVQARIDGKWLERPYTLTSSAVETEYYEITVKREDRGTFSRWMFHHRREDALIRVSRPQGNYVLDDGDARPVVALVAGIGVTPAVSFCRSAALAGNNRSIHVHYSATRLEDLVFADELQRLSRDHSNIFLQTQITSARGRLDQTGIETLVSKYPDAVFYLCGPEGYLQAISQDLLTSGVTQDRIRTEEFVHAAATNAAEPPAACPAHQGTRRGAMLVPPYEMGDGDSLVDQARVFLYQFYYEKGVPEAFEPRRRQVEEEIAQTGTYWQTEEELTFASRLAWRNSTRCIGRLFWEGLHVRDRRHLQTEEEIFAELLEHIRLATNQGNLRAVMTVFPPAEPGRKGIQIWNPQVIRYAGYQQPDGTVIGDPWQVDLTNKLLEMGWSGGKRTPFDVLPVVIQRPDCEPKWFEIPPEIILEVPISHPQYHWFAELGLRWYALPLVAELGLEAGGVSYSAAPFNGWYMGTEIGARNFGDEFRYNMLPTVADKMGLDRKQDRSLWKDRAIVELNVAVLHSFEQQGVKILDHHAASRDFLEFCEVEQVAGREVKANWSWIIPPISGSTMDVFHGKVWEDISYSPGFSYREQPPWV
jgi:nitric-oxide synthase